EGSLHKVMALDVPAKRRTAGEDRQPGRLRKCLRAHDGVVAPIVAALLMPRREPRGYDGAIKGDRELLQAREQGAAADEAWHGLEQGQPRVARHCELQFDEQGARHDTIGVEDDEALIGGPEALDPVSDVAGLLADIFRARAVINGDAPLQPA